VVERHPNLYAIHIAAHMTACCGYWNLKPKMVSKSHLPKRLCCAFRSCDAGLSILHSSHRQNWQNSLGDCLWSLVDVTSTPLHILCRVRSSPGKADMMIPVHSLLACKCMRSCIAAFLDSWPRQKWKPSLNRWRAQAWQSPRGWHLKGDILRVTS